MLIPDIEQVASHSLSSDPYAFILPYTSIHLILQRLCLAERRRMPVLLKDAVRGAKGIKKVRVLVVQSCPTLSYPMDCM